MKYLNELLFLLVVLAANVIQGITGFAGTVLAMPPSVLLVGMDTAKPILNVLGLLSGVWVVATSHKHVNVKEFLKAAAVMAAGLFAGIFVKDLFADKAKLMHIVLGVIVVLVGAVGLLRTFFPPKRERSRGKIESGAILVASGVVHGLFVCGGPLLVIYMQDRLKEKDAFRATISCVWIVLNGILLVDDLRLGHWTAQTLTLAAPAVLVLFAGMFLGGILYKKMSRELFIKLTFVLLIVSGALLFV